MGAIPVILEMVSRRMMRSLVLFASKRWTRYSRVRVGENNERLKSVAT
jgi:hypothetical protein